MHAAAEERCKPGRDRVLVRDSKGAARVQLEVEVIFPVLLTNGCYQLKLSLLRLEVQLVQSVLLVREGLVAGQGEQNDSVESDHTSD